MGNSQRPIKILIVDDDPAAQSRLDQTLRDDTYAKAWDVRFVTNGHAALAELEFHGSADVVVTDLHMPMMDGAALLTTIRAQYPSTVRIISSEFKYLSTALRSIPVAHQFLESPIDAVTLSVAIERTIEIQQRIVQAPMRSGLGTIDSLPSPPASVLELNHALANEDVSIDQIASIIERDTAMTAKLLQLVNSSVFGLTRRITNVRQATAYLGIATVRNLLIAVELVRAFVPGRPELARAAEQLHSHSMAVAEMARLLMKGHHHSEDAFAAGMLHDLGLLAIISIYPERFIALRDAVQNGTSLDECEINILGAHHADIVAYLLGLWGLPHSLVETVALSHDADILADRTMSPAHAVFIAEQILNVSGAGGASWETGRLPSDDYLIELGIDELVAGLVGRVRS